MFTTLIGVTSELKQSEIATNLVPESEIRPNLHISYDFYGKHWYNPLSNKTYLLRTDDFRRQPNSRGRSGASLLVLTLIFKNWQVSVFAWYKSVTYKGFTAQSPNARHPPPPPPKKKEKRKERKKPRSLPPAARPSNK